MENWSERMIQTLQLNGMSESTQFAYVRAVRQLSDFYQKTPDVITEEELRQYFLHKKNVSLWSPRTMSVTYCGIRYFYTKVLQHEWHLFCILRAPRIMEASKSHTLLDFYLHELFLFSPIALSLAAINVLIHRGRNLTGRDQPLRANR